MELIILAGLTIILVTSTVFLLFEWGGGRWGWKEIDLEHERETITGRRCSLCISYNLPPRIEQQIHRLRPSEIAVQHDLAQTLFLGSANPSTSGTAKKP